MTTTAEGVETKQLLDMLTEIGCTEAQGYYLGRPMPVASTEELIYAGERSLTTAAQ